MNRLKVWLAVMVVLVSGVMEPMGWAAKVTVQGDMVMGSCNIELQTPSTVDFGRSYVAQDFANGGSTVAVKSISLAVANCDIPTGAPGYFTMTVEAGPNTVTATTGPATGHVFMDTAGKTTGFMIRPLNNTDLVTGPDVWTDPLSTFYDPARSLADHQETNIGNWGAMSPDIKEGTLVNYAVGYVQVDPTVSAAPETVTATLLFTLMFK